MCSAPCAHACPLGHCIPVTTLSRSLAVSLPSRATSADTPVLALGEAGRTHGGQENFEPAAIALSPARPQLISARASRS